MFFSTALDFIKGQVCTNSLHDSAARRSLGVNGSEVGPSDENDATTWVKEECVLNSSRFSHVAALCTEEGYTARRMKRRLLSLPKAGFSPPPHLPTPLSRTTQEQCCSFPRLRRGACHAAVPPSPGGHGNGVWEGLSSIFN